MGYGGFSGGGGYYGGDGGGGGGGIGCQQGLGPLSNPFCPIEPITAPPLRRRLHRTYFLTVKSDCYEVPENGGFVTRNIMYQLKFLDEEMSTPMGFSAVIWEHLTGNLPMSGADSPSSSRPGWFPDQQSAANMKGIEIMQGTQTFTAKLRNGTSVGLPVHGFGGLVVELNILRHRGYVSINGDTGGTVNPRTGTLIEGTYTKCN